MNITPVVLDIAVLQAVFPIDLNALFDISEVVKGLLYDTVRGMLPHKTERGQLAMGRMKTFEGMPHPYDKMKRTVVPDALKATRLKPGRKFCVLKDLSHSVGWKHKDLIERLESKRKVRSEAFYQKKKAAATLRAKAAKATTLDAETAAQLAAYGH